MTEKSCVLSVVANICVCVLVSMEIAGDNHVKSQELFHNCLSVYLSVCLCVCLCVCVSFYLSVCLPVCLSVRLFVCPSVRRLSVVRLSVLIASFSYFFDALVRESVYVKNY